MTLAKPAKIESLLEKPPADIAVFLVYGPDQGLVSERVQRLCAACVEDIQDAFQLVRLDGEALAQEPSRLIDEATTIPLFGGKRAIWLRPGNRQVHSAIEALLHGPSGAAPVIIEAGELTKKSSLFQLCEKSEKALVFACYVDEGAALEKTILETLQRHQLGISQDARQFLATHLGQDRLATRSELEKLCLYAQGKTQIDMQDVAAIIADIPHLTLDDACDAAFSGQKREMDHHLMRLLREGHNAGQIVLALLRHALALLTKRLEVEKGQEASTVVERWQGLYFRRKPAVTRQLRHWTSKDLRLVIDQLQDTLLQTRKMTTLDEAWLNRVSLRIASHARRSTG
jgi:DNA polymerase III subunit delta